jgi:SpoVK/Ycf46/Vps4 family AAA+-type ATPase
LAKAIAGEANAAFLTVTAGDVLSKFIGESETAVRNTFARAAEIASKIESKCTVIFFDEIDALGQSRDIQHGDGEACTRRVLAELLIQLNLIADSFKQRSTYQALQHTRSDVNSYVGTEETRIDLKSENIRIFVVAATNRIQDCDEALRRRFGIQIEIGLPNRSDRKKMILRFLEGIEHTIIKEELEYISVRTENWSGSDLENLTREAAMAPVRECIRNAARIRQRTVKAKQQHGGDSTVQIKETKCHASATVCTEYSHWGDQFSSLCNDPDNAARACLLQGFRSLRPVTVYDFDCGICSFTGQETIPYYVHPSASAKRSTTSQEHYDTSSGDDEE